MNNKIKWKQKEKKDRKGNNDNIVGCYSLLKIYILTHK